MKRMMSLALFVVLLGGAVQAQQTSFQDSLLDRMTGKWMLQGTIAGQNTTHDVTVEWVLAHNYLQIHEVSREKDVQGAARLMAVFFIRLLLTIKARTRGNGSWMAKRTGSRNPSRG